MPDDGPVDALPAPRAVGKPAYRSTRTSPQARPPATRREPPAPAPPAIQTPATLPAVTAPPTEPQPPALCARRARAVTPVPPWPSPRAAQPRHPSAKSSICRSRRIPFLHGTTRSHRKYVGGVRGRRSYGGPTPKTRIHSEICSGWPACAHLASRRRAEVAARRSRPRGVARGRRRTIGVLRGVGRRRQALRCPTKALA